MNILVTAAGTVTANNVIKALKKAGKFRIIATDINDKEFTSGSYFADKFYKVPYGIDREYIPKLLEIAEKEQIKIIIPIVDSEILAFSKNKNKFEALGVGVVVSDIETVEVCNDKYKTYQFFKNNNIPTAETFLPEYIKGIKLDTFPMLVKPREGVGSTGIYKVFDRQGLNSVLRHTKDVIIQKFINGQEYTIDTFSDRNSEIKARVPRLRIEVKAGVSYKGETVKDPYLIEMADKITVLLKIKGPSNIQCIKSDNKYYFIEVNPRFSGGLPLTIKAGVNTPLMAVDMLTSSSPVKSNFEYELVKMVRFVDEVP